MRDPDFKRYISMIAAFFSIFVVGSSVLLDEYRLDEYRNVTLVVLDDYQILISIVAITTSMLAFIFFLHSLRRRARLRASPVFIGYSHGDRDVAKKIANLLTENSLEPWLDVDKISAGEDIQEAIQSGMDECAMAVVIFSENSRKFWRESQISAAIERMKFEEKPIIPVLYDGGELPDELRHIHFADMREPAGEEFLVQSIVRAIQRADHKSRRPSLKLDSSES